MPILTGLAMAASGSWGISCMDRFSAVHQKDPIVWYICCHVHRHLIYICSILPRLLAVHMGLCTLFLYTDAKSGQFSHNKILATCIYLSIHFYLLLQQIKILV